VPPLAKHFVVIHVDGLLDQFDKGGCYKTSDSKSNWQCSYIYTPPVPCIHRALLSTSSVVIQKLTKDNYLTVSVCKSICWSLPFTWLSSTVWNIYNTVKHPWWPPLVKQLPPVSAHFSKIPKFSQSNIWNFICLHVFVHPLAVPGGELRISSDREVQRMFLVLKFTISGFFCIRKFCQVFFQEVWRSGRVYCDSIIYDK